jgi:hypothetical protein
MVSPRIKRQNGLELDDHPHFSRRSHVIQRAAWGVMALVLAAAILGIFGRGPLSRASAATPDGRIAVRYERVLRHDARSDYRIRLAPGASGVLLSSGLVEALDIRGITPQPLRQEATPSGLVCTFAAAGNSPVDVRFQFETRKLWGASGWIGEPGGPGAAIRHYILP